MKEHLQNLAKKFHPLAVSVRRHLHREPELSFQEYKTTQYLAEQLSQQGFKNIKRITDTGFYVDLLSENESSQTLLIRADIDALPIQEVEGRPYGSCVPGVMHACGHDVHTACVFATLLILNESRSLWKGRIRFVFQPGEERSPGGASVMIKNGLLENPEIQKAIALHVHPDLPVGTAGFCPGPFMAASDEIYITVKGKGGHAALKDKYRNPIPAAADVLRDLYAYFNQPEHPEPRVFAIGKIFANGACNVIPDECRMEGTLRTFDESWRASAKKKLPEIGEKAVMQHGCNCEIRIAEGYPVLENDAFLTEQCRKVAQHVLGASNVHTLPPRMTAEDFAFISRKIPSCFFRLGVANPEKGIQAPVHTPDFDVDENCLYYGSLLLSSMAVHILS